MSGFKFGPIPTQSSSTRSKIPPSIAASSDGSSQHSLRDDGETIVDSNTEGTQVPDNGIFGDLTNSPFKDNNAGDSTDLFNTDPNLQLFPENSNNSNSDDTSNLDLFANPSGSLKKPRENGNTKSSKNERPYDIYKIRKRGDRPLTSNEDYNSDIAKEKINISSKKKQRQPEDSDSHDISPEDALLFTETDELKVKVDFLQRELANAKKEKANLSFDDERNQELALEIRQKTDEIASIRSTLSENQARIAQLEETTRRVFDDRIKELKEQAKSKNADLRDRDKRIDDLEAKYSAAQEQIEFSKEELGRRSNQLADLQVQNNQTKDRISRLERENQDLLQQVVTSEQESTANLNDVKKIQEEMNNLRTTKEKDINTARLDSQRKIDALNERITVLTGQASRIGDLENLLSERGHINDSLHARLKNISDKYDADFLILEERKNVIENQLRTLQAAQEKSLLQIQSSTQTISDLKRKSISDDITLRQLTSQTAVLNSRIKQLETNSNATVSQLTQVEDDRDRLVVENEELKESVRKLDQERDDYSRDHRAFIERAFRDRNMEMYSVLNKIVRKQNMPVYQPRRQEPVNITINNPPPPQPLPSNSSAQPPLKKTKSYAQQRVQNGQKQNNTQIIDMNSYEPPDILNQTIEWEQLMDGISRDIDIGNPHRFYDEIASLLRKDHRIPSDFMRDFYNFVEDVAGATANEKKAFWVAETKGFDHLVNYVIEAATHVVDTLPLKSTINPRLSEQEIKMYILQSLHRMNIPDSADSKTKKAQKVVSPKMLIFDARGKLIKDVDFWYLVQNKFIAHMNNKPKDYVVSLSDKNKHPWTFIEKNASIEDVADRLAKGLWENLQIRAFKETTTKKPSRLSVIKYLDNEAITRTLAELNAVSADRTLVWAEKIKDMLRLALNNKFFQSLNMCLEKLDLTFDIENQQFRDALKNQHFVRFVAADYSAVITRRRPTATGIQLASSRKDWSDMFDEVRKSMNISILTVAPSRQISDDNLNLINLPILAGSSSSLLTQNQSSLNNNIFSGFRL